jgi:glyoxylase-like metal-dependent hydrolase (beta-lactamase superfamily II)
MVRQGEGRLTRRQALQGAALVGGGLVAGSALGGARGVAAQGMPAMFPQVQATLTRLAEDVWVWTNGGYNSLIISSDAGTLVTEPSSQFNRQASALLKAVSASVSGGQPVKYVVFSHDHADHNTGGDVFADTAEFISQELAAPKIAARNDPRSPVPTITFAEHMTLDLGGKTIELHYLGRNHSDNSLVLEYPARRLIHAVDWMENRRLPFRDLQDSYLDEWLAGLDRVIADFEFDTLVPGHTPPGPKGIVVELRQYWLDLFAAIRAAQAMGLADNSPEMVEFVRARLAPTYGTWGAFADFLPLNIQGVLRIGIPNR